MTVYRPALGSEKLVSLMTANSIAREAVREKLIASDCPTERERSIDLYDRLVDLDRLLHTEAMKVEASEHEQHRRTWPDPDCYSCRREDTDR